MRIIVEVGSRLGSSLVRILLSLITKKDKLNLSFQPRMFLTRECRQKRNYILKWEMLPKSSSVRGKPHSIILGYICLWWENSTFMLQRACVPEMILGKWLRFATKYLGTLS